MKRPVYARVRTVTHVAEGEDVEKREWMIQWGPVTLLLPESWITLPKVVTR